MSLDSRSLERLRALGRKLPEKISEPERPITPKATEARHRVETEKNPDALFHELMQVSEDGTVPTHLMERLKQLEAQRRSSPARATTDSNLPELPATSNPGPGKTTQPKRPKVTPGSEEESLYVAFGQLLLEDEGEDA